jgi:hypothetical protein
VKRFAPFVAVAWVVCGCKAPIPPVPVYGSTPALSTTEGFVVGKWKSNVDDRKASNKDMADMMALINRIFSKTIDIHKDGTYDITVNKRAKGTGKWKVGSGGIDLQLTSFDNGPAVMGREPLDLSSFAREVTHLGLNADKKRLEQPMGNDSQAPKNAAPVGILTWDRVMN